MSGTQRGVYVIENLRDGCAYVGYSDDLQLRWWTHRSSLRRGKHHNQPLQLAWNANGEAQFRFRALESIDHSKPFDNYREHHWMKTLLDQGVALYNQRISVHLAR